MFTTEIRPMTFLELKRSRSDFGLGNRYLESIRNTQVQCPKMFPKQTAIDRGPNSVEVGRDSNYVHQCFLLFVLRMDEIVMMKVNLCVQKFFFE